jgi:hypothetical protein
MASAVRSIDGQNLNLKNNPRDLAKIVNIFNIFTFLTIVAKKGFSYLTISYIVTVHRERDII